MIFNSFICRQLHGHVWAKHVIDSTQYINKAILCHENNYDNINNSEEAFNNLE
jgi:hypothetical protein